MIATLPAQTRMRANMQDIAPLTDLHYHSIPQIAAAFAAGTLSSIELTRAMLDRIQHLDPALRSYITVTPDLAMDQAARADLEITHGQSRSPLHGVPIAVKDLCCTRDSITTAGMAIHRDHQAGYDATVVERLRRAGAVLLGKLHMTEGATISHHPELPRPVNPWGEAFWTGASSSGSGVATAAGLCFASLGSDTGGSIRYPSAANGLTGVKPTWGRVSRHGVFDLAPSYDTVGPIARSAVDCAIMFDAIAGYDPKEPTSLLAPVTPCFAGLNGVSGAAGLRIGIDSRFNNEGADPEAMALIEVAAEKFAQIGADLQDISFPDPRLLLEHLLELQMAELAHAHRATFPSQADRYGPWLREGIESGLRASPVVLADALFERELFRGRLARLFTQIDIVLLPVLPGGTPDWEEPVRMIEQDQKAFFRYTGPLNASGSPAVTLPCGFTQGGRPVGLQLAGPHCSEAMLLRAAHAYQQVTDWHLRRPPVG
jgi:amidase